ncbi:hypothetical protein FG93_03484 [Bosea sp. LC85]|nr:hypothetical protein FG93_03484 [Bosea sp. LC85]
MLVVEGVVDRGQADILVPATVADDVVGIEQFVVIGCRNPELVERDLVSSNVVIVGNDEDGCGCRVSVMIDQATRHRSVGDIIQEGAAGGHGARCRGQCARIALYRPPARDQLRKAVGSANELAIEVGQDRRNAQDVGIGQQDAEFERRLLLDLCPGRRTAIRPLQHLPGSNRLAIQQIVFPQKDLVGRIRGIDLVQVDPRRRLVVVFTHVIRSAQHTVGARLVLRARQHHEVGRAAGDVKRIVGLERDIDRAAAALADQIKPVIEELAEQREEPVERSGVTQIGRDIRD